MEQGLWLKPVTNQWINAKLYGIGRPFRFINDQRNHYSNSSRAPPDAK